jgi:hypothetical protein
MRVWFLRLRRFAKYVKLSLRKNFVHNANNLGFPSCDLCSEGLSNSADVSTSVDLDIADNTELAPIRDTYSVSQFLILGPFIDTGCLKSSLSVTGAARRRRYSADGGTDYPGARVRITVMACAAAL